MDALIEVLATSPTTLLLFVGILGLIVGSFLNVVIYRLPVMMEREWRCQCAELLEQPLPEEASRPFNLVTPPSRCQNCQHPIKPWENIPVLSYLWQRGRCTACQTRISPRYPIIELSCAVLSMIVAWQLGFGWSLLSVLFLTWALLALSMIDVDHQLLPDSMTLPLLWLGLLLNLWPETRFVPIEEAILGAVFGYLSLWSVYWLFKLTTGKEGMGYGDFKLLAMFGAWLGWQALPMIILMSSLVGAIIGITLIVVQGRDRNQPIPFGPYLACAGWITLLWGQYITQQYMVWTGFNSYP